MCGFCSTHLNYDDGCVFEKGEFAYEAHDSEPTVLDSGDGPTSPSQTSDEQQSAPASDGGLAGEGFLSGSSAQYYFETADAAGNTGTTYTISVGDFVEGNVSSAGDRDWYAIELVAGQEYTVSLVGTGSGNLTDTLVNVYNSTGTSILFANDDGLEGRNSQVTFTATTTGTYYIDAGAWSTLQGEYNLTVTEGDFADFNADMAAGVMDADVSWSTGSGTTTITYAYRQSDIGEQASFSQLTATQIAVFETLLAQYEDVANVEFSRVNPSGYSNNATILIANYNDPNDGAGAYAYYPGSTAATSDAGDVWLNLDSISTTSLPAGSFSNFAILHELGHAMGLSHPGLYNAAPGVNITYGNNAQFVQDTQQFTVMSYFSETNTGANYAGYAQTLMVMDLLALHNIYGANLTTRTGNTVYGFNSTETGLYNFATNAAPALTIWDAGGNDTLDVSGFSNNTEIDLREGAYSSVGGYTYNIGIAYGAIVENAIGGSASETIYGNAQNNTFTGNGGNDVIDGKIGTDTVVYSGNWGTGAISANYTVTLNSDGSVSLSNIGGTEGTDTLISIERLDFADRDLGLRAGTTGADTLTGDGTDTLFLGGDGADYLLDLSSGDDLLFGGAGNDTLQGSGGADVNNGGSGTDTVRYANSGAGVNVNLATGTATGGDAQGDTFDSIENLVGSQQGDTLVGDSGVNDIQGLNGNDTISGGAGADTLNGGAGIDTLDYSASVSTGSTGFTFGVNVIDGVYVALGGGTLYGGDAAGDVAFLFENLIGSQNNDWLVGTNVQNVLTGGLGNDWLLDLAGDDTLIGGDGYDWLQGGAGGDINNGGDGVDRVRYTQSDASVNVNLTTGTGTGGHAQGDTYVSVEQITGSYGFGDVLTGNGSDNLIEGLTGDDHLDGGMGLDTDLLSGGIGSDVFHFSSNLWGSDYLIDFEDGIDLIDLTGSGLSLNDFTQVDTAYGLRLDYYDGINGLQTIVIAGLDAGDITIDDFV